MNKLLKLLTKRNEKGFSLIELMIVVVIIGILSTVAVPQYQNFQKKARQGEAKANLGGIYTTMKTFQAEWNQYYGDFNALGYDMAGTLSYNIGFGTNAPAGPATHPVLAYQAVAPIFAAHLKCGAPNVKGTLSPECDLGIGAAAILPPATALITAVGPLQTFTAGARGNIDADATFDYWTINNLKVLQQPVPADNDVTF